MHKRAELDFRLKNLIIPSTFGDLLVMFVKMLIKTRNRVTKSVIRPGISSGGIRKLAWNKESFQKYHILFGTGCSQSKLNVK